jgi:hypothetical protein
MIRLYVLALIVATTSVGSAQSLAEIAKKEKERRQNLPAGRVYGESDLGTSGAADVSAEETKSPDDETPKEKLGDWRQRQQKRNRARDEEWEKIFPTFQSRFASVLALRDEYADLYFNGLPIGADNKRISCARILSRWSVPGWTQHAITCESLEDKIRAQEALLKEIEDECLESARRLGIPPGRARLY